MWNVSALSCWACSVSDSEPSDQNSETIPPSERDQSSMDDDTRTVPPPASDEIAPAPQDDDWEDALRAAFSGPRRSTTPPSVLRQLTGEDSARSSVVLRDPTPDDEPVVRIPGSDSERPLLRGGRYQVLGEIARGGVGVVMKGRDVDLGRDLAMKFLHDRHASNGDLVQRFVEEAQIGGQLQHPGIVPVYDVGVDDGGRPYFTMKLIRGQTLSQVLSERDSPSDERGRWMRVFEQICDAMAYAHSRGVIHRDLKPANVLVGSFGEVQIVDWGLAKVLQRGGVADEETVRDRCLERDDSDGVVATVRSGPDAAESQVGSVLGTPAYMPPEQALGQVELMDERSDVFSLGAVLCEIVTGMPPYRGKDSRSATIQAARADLDDAFKRLDESGAEPAVIQIARSCLQKDTSRRPRDARVLARTVRDYIESVEQRARAAEVDAASAKIRVVAERKSRRLTVLLAGTVLAAVLIGGSVFGMIQLKIAERRGQIENRVETALTDGATALDKGRFAAASAAVDLIDQLVQNETVSAELATRSATLRGQIQTRQKSAQLLSQLDQIRYEDLESAHAGYVQAFEAAGLDPLAEDLSEFDAAAGDVGSYRLALAQALDDWSMRRRATALFSEPGSTTDVERRVFRKEADHLMTAAARLDPDPWRNRLREATKSRDREDLLDLVDTVTASDLPPVSLGMLGMSLASGGDIETALAVLDEGFRIYPGDFLLNVQIAMLKPQLEEPDLPSALRHASIALALRPKSPLPRLLLSFLYARTGDADKSKSYAAEALERTDDEQFRARLKRMLEKDQAVEGGRRRGLRMFGGRGRGGRRSPEADGDERDGGGQIDPTDAAARVGFLTRVERELKKVGRSGSSTGRGPSPQLRGLLRDLRGPAFAFLRDPAQLAKLDEEERVRWQAIWERVRAFKGGKRR